MILSDGEIRAALHLGHVGIEPAPSDEQFATSAVDLYLGEELYEIKTPEELVQSEIPGVIRPVVIDPAVVDMLQFQQKYLTPLPLTGVPASYDLPPGKFVVGMTRETLTLPRTSRLAARVEGRSTLARLGLMVHMTAPVIHSGFHGRIALEMINFGEYPIRLTPGRLRICQVVFERMGKTPRGPLVTAFIGQKELRRRPR